MKQSIITILLTVLMCMTGAKTFAHDISVANSDGVTIYYVWTNNKTELAVSYRGSYSSSYSNEYSGNVVIPSSVVYNGNTYSVTSIGGYAFYECSGLTSVTIPNSVTSIGERAFSYCSGLTSVTIPNSVKSIGYQAFSYCSGLTSVTIPNSVTSIGSSAFDGCSGLTTIVSEIKTPFAIGSIGSSSVTLVVPAGTKAAYQSTAGWSSFTKTVEVGEGGVVGSIFEIDFIRYSINENNTTSLTYAKKVISGAIVISSQVEFNGYKYDVTSIGDKAFSGCSDLTSVTIPNSVTSIGYQAFLDCSGLTSVTIPNSVTSIGQYAFSNCSGLTSVTIGNSVTSIGDGAFYYCSGLTSITIPNSVTSIGYRAFHGCSGLTSVTIGNSVTSIGEEAFYGCTALTSIVIGSGVKSIGYRAFYDTNLKKTIWLTNTPPYGYSDAKGTVNYVSNDQFTFYNQVKYQFLSSYFDVDGIRYVPVSPSERTCDAIDCVYDESATNTKIASTVSYKGVTMNR